MPICSRPYTHVDNLDFSFSGLKTALLTYLNEHPARGGGQSVSAKPVPTRPLPHCVMSAHPICWLWVAETLSLKMEKAFHRERQKGSLDRRRWRRGRQYAGSSRDACPAEKVGQAAFCSIEISSTDNAVMIAHAGELLACKGYGQG